MSISIGNTKMYIVFDIGGSKMRIAASKNLSVFTAPRIIPTPKTFDNGIKTFVSAARELAGKNHIRAVAGGIPGLLNKNKTMVLAAPNLKKWSRKPLQRTLSRALHALTMIENDAAMAGLGELYFGAGQQYKKKIMAYLTVSTGVGGARFVNGTIDHNATGFEPGHQIITGPLSTDQDTRIPRCSCGSNSGHLEAHISGRAIEKQYGKKPYEITNKKIWAQKARLLSYGLHNIIVLWSPHVIVLGGSMMKKIGIPIPAIRRYMQQNSSSVPQLPVIKKAALGDLGGLYGAMQYLRTLRHH